MAESKLTELDEEFSPTDADLLYIVTDPDGTPTSKRVRLGDLPRPSKIDVVDYPASAYVDTAADSFESSAAVSAFAKDGAGGEASLGAEVWEGNADVWAVLAADGNWITAFYFNLHEGDLSAGFFDADPVQVPIQIDSSDTLENRVAAIEAAFVALGFFEDTA